MSARSGQHGRLPGDLGAKQEDLPCLSSADKRSPELSGAVEASRGACAATAPLNVHWCVRAGGGQPGHVSVCSAVVGGGARCELGAAREERMGFGSLVAGRLTTVLPQAFLLFDTSHSERCRLLHDHL